MVLNFSMSHNALDLDPNLLDFQPPYWTRSNENAAELHFDPIEMDGNFLFAPVQNVHEILVGNRCKPDKHPIQSTLLYRCRSYSKLCEAPLPNDVYGTRSPLKTLRYSACLNEDVKWI